MGMRMPDPFGSFGGMMGAFRAFLQNPMNLIGKHAPNMPQDILGYPVHFSGNIAIAEGGTAGTVSLAITVNGTVLPESRMDSTPAAVGDSNNINTQVTADVWQGCCESITVRNISDQAVTITESVLDIGEPNLNR